MLPFLVQKLWKNNQNLDMKSFWVISPKFFLAVTSKPEMLESQSIAQKTQILP